MNDVASSTHLELCDITRVIRLLWSDENNFIKCKVYVKMTVNKCIYKHINVVN